MLPVRAVRGETKSPEGDGPASGKLIANSPTVVNLSRVGSSNPERLRTGAAGLGVLAASGRPSRAALIY